MSSIFEKMEEQKQLMETFNSNLMKLVKKQEEIEEQERLAKEEAEKKAKEEEEREEELMEFVMRFRS